MKYFLHNTSAFQDEKITELYMNFGYEGIGLYFTTLEKLALQEKPIKTDVLKKQLNIGKRLNKCWKFMESLGIISSNNGETFSKQLLNFSEKYKIKKEKNRKRISEWRKNQDVIKNVTCNEHVRNISKVKLTKVNKSKLKQLIIIYKIFIFWNSQKIILHNNLTKEIKTEITKKLKSYTLEEIKLSINRYSEILNCKDYFFKYKWSLEIFLKRKEGFADFLDSGVKWENYKTYKQSEEIKQTEIKKKSVAIEN